MEDPKPSSRTQGLAYALARALDSCLSGNARGAEESSWVLDSDIENGRTRRSSAPSLEDFRTPRTSIDESGNTQMLIKQKYDSKEG
ncbi:hypothetical protein N7478_002261 [Penicillium angulare]|uniref:uncharacterized protein n=1 Tax=Penicillium angulare TaxID=116970 RepID=UPI002540E2B1|nr:uncharacterized protein N7478_002261 [Penicillium angulare]KAJ5289231.1 hypothetical protein N7478_002261 [Penicillium angulare]